MSDMFPTVLLKNWVASLDAAAENREQNAVAERKKERKIESLSLLFTTVVDYVLLQSFNFESLLIYLSVQNGMFFFQIHIMHMV